MENLCLMFVFVFYVCKVFVFVDWLDKELYTWEEEEFRNVYLLMTQVGLSWGDQRGWQDIKIQLLTMLVLGDTLSGFKKKKLFKRIICKKTHDGIWQHGESLSISAT